jgi:hypothetical protein
MINWIYSNPTWLWGTAFVIGVTAMSCLGLVLIHRFIDPEMRRKHNDIAAATMAIVGVAYAVLLAFIAVAAWQDFSDADKIVDTEASYVGNLFRDTTGLPLEKARPMRGAVRRYIELVMTKEWPEQQKGQPIEAAQPILLHLHRLITNINPQTYGEAAITGELLRTINLLYSARRSRILAANGAIPETIWWIIGIGTIITVGFMCFFGAPNFLMHLGMTAMVASSMALVIVLIVSLDRPFRGDLCVSLDAFQNVKDSIALIDSSASQPPGAEPQ